MTISALPRFVGDRKHHACVLSDAGDIFCEEVRPNIREWVLAFAQRFPVAKFVMETGTPGSATDHRALGRRAVHGPRPTI